MLHNSITNHIHIIRFLAHKQIYRFEDAFAGVFNYTPAQSISLYKSFCHIMTKV